MQAVPVEFDEWLRKSIFEAEQKLQAAKQRTEEAAEKTTKARENLVRAQVLATQYNIPEQSRAEYIATVKNQIAIAIQNEQQAIAQYQELCAQMGQ